MKVIINPKTVAMILAHKKIEKKYEAIGFSPYEDVYENYVGRRLTEDAKVDYDKHYKYFLDIILSRGEEVEVHKTHPIH
tara:strand:+ start:429 stop:665 length:237 start_codon:yes stop_codon:yes gene_type:complete